MPSEILTLGINWVRTVDVPVAQAGERFVCLIPARTRADGPMKYMVEVVTATETGWANEAGYCLADSVAWCSEYEFHAAATRVFGRAE